MLFGSYFIRCVRLIIRYLSWCREQCLGQTSKQEIQKFVRRHKYREQSEIRKGRTKHAKEASMRRDMYTVHRTFYRHSVLISGPLARSIKQSKQICCLWRTKGHFASDGSPMDFPMLEQCHPSCSVPSIVSAGRSEIVVRFKHVYCLPCWIKPVASWRFNVKPPYSGKIKWYCSSLLISNNLVFPTGER